jgi:hypothetical protein
VGAEVWGAGSIPQGADHAAMAQRRPFALFFSVFLLLLFKAAVNSLSLSLLLARFLVPSWAGLWPVGFVLNPYSPSGDRLMSMSATSVSQA